MGIVKATKTGNWSDSSVWSPSAPTSSDDVYSNTFTVTIDTSPTVLSISNASASGVTAGGTFVLNNGVTLTATATIGVLGGAGGTVVVFSSTGPSSATVIANIRPSSVNTASNQGVANTSSGTLNIVGSVTGGQSLQNNCHGAVNSSSGTLNITGNITGGDSNATTSYGVLNSSIGTVNITGNVIGGLVSNGPNHGAINSSTGTLNITGTVTGGATGSSGAVNNISGVMNITGNLVSSNTSPAVSGSSPSQVTILTGPFLTTSLGINPIYAARWFWANSNVTPTYYQIRTANLATIRPLYTADSVGGNPAITNVRSGTVFGPANELTGTCAVPGAASVVVGVPVDNTTGTAAVTAATIRAAVGLASANLDTQLAAIPSAATIASTVWAAATRTLTTAIDNSATIAAAVWAYATGRTITGGTVDTLTNAPSVPSAATIASQVRTELSTELGRIDVATSSRLAASSYSAAPSAATNATAVRSELATELGRIDATVSSRLAPSGTLARVTLTDTTTTVTNSSQVDNAAIADAVRTELTPELARVANAATTQEVGDIVEGALALPET